jgi:hypothetical protein
MAAGRPLKRFLLAVGAVAWASLAIPVMADTIFPSDGQDAKVAGAAELLQAVCPGHVDGTDCSPCPEFTFFANQFGLAMRAVSRGHFLSPTSEDAVLATVGCEPTPGESDGGTILLTRQSRQWKMLWYRLDINTSRCHKVPLSRREILVCIDEFGGRHGWNVTALYTVDLRNPIPSESDGWTHWFFVLRDYEDCCTAARPDPGDPVSWGAMEGVEFGTSTAGGPPPISVTATFGKGVWTAEALKSRDDGGYDFEKLLPPLKHYRIDFIWDGHDYKPAPASVATAKIFAEQ